MDRLEAKRLFVRVVETESFTASLARLGRGSSRKSK